MGRSRAYRSEEINKEIGEELVAIQNWLDAHPVERAKIESGTSGRDDFKSAWIVWKYHGVRTRLRNGEVIHISLRMPWPWTEPLIPAVARAPFDEDYLTAMDIENYQTG
jgi:hypothetical protein